MYKYAKKQIYLNRQMHLLAEQQAKKVEKSVIWNDKKSVK